jgi:hypothetical protein
MTLPSYPNPERPHFDDLARKRDWRIFWSNVAGTVLASLAVGFLLYVVALVVTAGQISEFLDRLLYDYP